MDLGEVVCENVDWIIWLGLYESPGFY